jgi:DUF1680 family protein
MAQVDALTGLNDYDFALNSIWNNLVTTRMHITGGLGAIAGLEGFGKPYELPNLTAYNETCAAVANVFFNQSLFLNNGDAKYLDIAEISLFNNALAGISLSGDRFFYVNPLEADGERKFNHGHGGRSEWFNCACCPPNISRLILQMPGYMYAYSDDKIYITHYGGSKTTVPLEKNKVMLEQTSNYPYESNIKLTVHPETEKEFKIAMRIPTWASSNEFAPGGLYPYKKENTEKAIIKVNNEEVSYTMEKGFAVIDREWKKNDLIELQLPMEVRLVKSIPEVTENEGKTAITRGPLVYCAEEIDNKMSAQEITLGNIDESQANLISIEEGILKGIHLIDLSDIKLIPYYTWCNRGDNRSMAVWIND